MLLLNTLFYDYNKKILSSCYYIRTVNALLLLNIINLRQLVYSLKQNRKFYQNSKRKFDVFSKIQGNLVLMTELYNFIMAVTYVDIGNRVQRRNRKSFILRIF